MIRYRVNHQPHEGYFPVGSIVTRLYSATPEVDGGEASALRVYTDGVSELALYDTEVDAIEDVKQPEDVTVDASAGSVKATFTGDDSKIGAYAVAGVILLAALGFFVLPIVIQLFKD